MNSYRRKIAAALCIGQLAAGGCVPKSLVRSQEPAGESLRVKPASLTEYMRAVYKLSHEAAVQDNERRDRLVERTPRLKDLVQRLSVRPDDAEARRELGLAYLQNGLPWSAYDLLTEAEAVLTGDASIQSALAAIWDGWQEYDMARRHAEQAVQLSPTASAYEVLGRIHLHADAPAKAAKAFLSGLELDSKSAVLLANTGYAFMLQSDWKTAQDFLQRALAVDSSIGEAGNNLAIVQSRLGNFDGALQQLMKINEPAAAMNNLGVLYLAQEKPAEARAAFQEAVRIDPSYARARSNLVQAPAPSSAAASSSSSRPPAIVYLAPAEGPQRPASAQASSVVARTLAIVQPVLAQPVVDSVKPAAVERPAVPAPAVRVAPSPPHRSSEGPVDRTPVPVSTIAVPELPLDMLGPVSSIEAAEAFDSPAVPAPLFVRAGPAGPAVSAPAHASAAAVPAALAKPELPVFGVGTRIVLLPEMPAQVIAQVSKNAAVPHSDIADQSRLGSAPAPRWGSLLSYLGIPGFGLVLFVGIAGLPFRSRTRAAVRSVERSRLQ